MQNFSQQLLEAYDKECRKELSISLAQAYLHSHMKAKEFGSFWAQAQSYLRWFYADVLLENAAKRMGLDFEVGSNIAKNCKHIAIHSNNWKMTVHHLSGNAPLPKQALYRAVYANQNYELNFGDENASSQEMEVSGGHVYMLHDGSNQNLAKLNLTIPSSDNYGILYTESLPIMTMVEAEAENVDSEIEDKIKILTEQIIKSQQS
ncbi:hypothetical protein LUE45_001017 [Salmonella enterica]|nr:hypothetical protein [Salmonella enterica]